jgi:hypothetical protein
VAAVGQATQPTQAAALVVHHLVKAFPPVLLRLHKREVQGLYRLLVLAETALFGPELAVVVRAELAGVGVLPEALVKQHLHLMVLAALAALPEVVLPEIQT